MTIVRGQSRRAMLERGREQSQKRQTSGTMPTVSTKYKHKSGSPSFQESPKRYPPGSLIIRFTGVATGVRNAAAAATVTVISSGRAETPSVAAAETAIGLTTSAVAMLLIN